MSTNTATGHGLPQKYQRPNELIVMTAGAASLRKLSKLTRLLYAAILKVSQEQMRASKESALGKNLDADAIDELQIGGFALPMVDLIKLIAPDKTTSVYTSAHKSLLEMKHTRVDWRSIDRNSELNDRYRELELLSEVGITENKDGVQVIDWDLPKTIKRLLIKPAKYTSIDLAQIIKLNSYTAIALYEICARYRGFSGADKPGTPFYSPEEWVTFLSPRSSKMLWRKFKSETVLDAIEEINLHTDIQIELFETRGDRRSIGMVRFLVSEKTAKREDSLQAHAEREESPQAAAIDRNADLLRSAMQAEIPKSAILEAIKIYSPAVISASIAAFSMRMKDEEKEPIENVSRYFGKILAETSRQLAESIVKPEPVVAKPTPVQAETLPKKEEDLEREAILIEIRKLPRKELEALVTKAYEHLVEKKIASATTRLNYSEFMSGQRSEPNKVFIGPMIQIYKNQY